MNRFYFHYRKCDGRMSVHFRNQCMPCDEVVCKRPVETKRNNRQPRLVMRGYAKSVIVVGGTAFIQ